MLPEKRSPEAVFLSERELANAARKARLQAGLTQKQVAEQLGVQQPSIAQAEGVPERQLSRLRIRIIERLSGETVSGPFWRLEAPVSDR